MLTLCYGAKCFVSGQTPESSYLGSSTGFAIYKFDDFSQMT